MKGVWVLGLVLVLLLAAGCTAKKAENKPDNAAPGPGKGTANDAPSMGGVQQESAATGIEESGASTAPTGFVFGIEYGVLGLAQAYKKTGAHAVKFTPALVWWKNIQKEEGAPYDWGAVDAHVKEYQEAGYDYMQLLLTSGSPWASIDGKDVLPKNFAPKPEFEDEYGTFVKAAVERYDLDGVDDMPGLKHAVNEWGVEREFTAYFPGSGQDYVRVLKLAYPAIKEANPNAKVMLNALLMWDIFQGNPSEGEIEKRFKNPLNGKRKDLTDIPFLLDTHAYFDVIDIHSLADYTEIPSTVKWLRREMDKRGTQKGIFIGDAFPMSPLLAYGFETCEESVLAAKPFYPVTKETRCEAAELLKALRNPKHVDHSKALEWLQQNVATGLVKKYVVAAGEGVQGINMGNLEDWPLPFGAGTAQYFGLMETVYGGGDMLAAHRTPGKERPGFFALQKVIGKLDGFDSVEKKDLGEHVYWYEFTRNGKITVVAWYEEGAFYGLNAVPPSRELVETPFGIVTLGFEPVFLNA
jgi:hypothetical protein